MGGGEEKKKRKEREGRRGFIFDFERLCVRYL